MTSKALKAGYGDDLFDNSPGLKLANSVVLRNENSSIDVSDQGHTYDFKDNRSAAEAPFATPTPTEDEELVCVRYEKSYPELDDLMEDDCDIVRPKKNGIKPWLEEIYKSSRGFELGTFDVSLLTVVWRKQSANWDALAMGYINDVVSLVHTYTIDVLSTICADKRIRRGVSSVLLDLLTARYKKGIDHAKMILVVEREGTPLTANHYFAENLEKW